MPEPIEIHVIGGKKGESIAIRLPDGQWGVVDNYTPTLKNPDSNPTLKFLIARGVQRLSFLCITHPHDDHYRGISHLLERFDPDHVWIFGAMSHHKLLAIIKLKNESSNASDETSENVDELVRTLDLVMDKRADKKRTPPLVVKRMQLSLPLLALGTNPPLHITSIGATGGDALEYEETLKACFTGDDDFIVSKVAGVNHNAISGGLLIEYGKARIVLGGDIEEKTWKQTLADPTLLNRLESQLVKVSHHASRTGYCEGLWDKFSPNLTAIAVITPYSSQGLPSPEGLAHIKQHAVEVFTVSVKGAALANDWTSASVSDAFSDLPADALLALQATFRGAQNRTDRLEGVCSFFVSDQGVVTHTQAGEAGPI